MTQAAEPLTSSRRSDTTRANRTAAQSPPGGSADFAQSIADVLQPNLSGLALGGSIEPAANVGRTPVPKKDAPSQNRSATEHGEESDHKKKAADIPKIIEAAAANLPDPAHAAAQLLKAPVHPENVRASSSSEGTDGHGFGTESADTSKATLRERSQQRAEAPPATTTSEPASSAANPSSVPQSPAASQAQATGPSANAEHASVGAAPDSSNNSEGSDQNGNRDAAASRASTQGLPSSSVAAASPLAASSASGDRQGSEQALKSLVGAAPIGTERAGTVGGPRATASTRNPAQPFAQSEEPLIAQLGRGLTAALRQKGGSVLIRLAPEALGQLRVHLTLDKSQVAARIETSTPEARDLLMKAESDLRTALEARGLQVKSVEIVNTGNPNGAPAANDQQPTSNSQQQPADTQHSGDHRQRRPSNTHAQRGDSPDESDSIDAISGAIAGQGAFGGVREEGIDGGFVLRVDMTA